MTSELIKKGVRISIRSERQEISQIPVVQLVVRTARARAARACYDDASRLLGGRDYDRTDHGRAQQR